MTIHHVCIQTAVYEASKRFYTELLGFKVVSETQNFHGRAFNTWLQAPDGFRIELQTAKAEQPLSPCEPNAAGIAHLCFVEKNLDACVETMLHAGCGFRRKHGEVIYTVLGGRLAKVIAPEGTVIELRESAEL